MANVIPIRQATFARMRGKPFRLSDDVWCSLVDRVRQALAHGNEEHALAHAQEIVHQAQRAGCADVYPPPDIVARVRRLIV